MATATSGAFETSVYDLAGANFPNRIRVEWSSSQSVANNTSTIYWTVKSAGGYGSWYVMTGPVTVNIAGVTVFNRSDRFQMWVGATLGSGSFTLTHNTDGTKSLTAWAEAAVYAYAISSTRYGYSIDLPTIPRASSISASGNTMGSPLTISISKASPSFTHTIYWQFGSRSGYCATNTSSSSITWTPPLDLANQIPNSEYGTGTLKCITCNGGTNVGEKSINFTLYVPNSIVPSITGFNSGIYYTDLPECNLYIKNHSKVKWDVSASSSYGATIQKCVINGQNLSYTSNSHSSVYTAISDFLTSAGEQTYTATVTDSRGRTATTSGKIYISNYDKPRILSATSFRSDASGSLNGGGSCVTHKLNVSFYSLNNTNNILIKAYSKKTSGGNFSNPVIIKNDASNTVSYTYTYPANTFALDTTYDFQIIIQDKIGQSSSVITHIGTKNIPLNISKDNKSVAIGGFAQPANNSIGRFDCAWDAHFNSAPIVGSDRKLKCNIQDIDIDIIDELQPVRYNLVNGDSNVVHYGFIAQDVEQALIDSGAIDYKTGIVHYDEDKDTKERSNYALAYDEIIPLLVKKCQELQQEINELKGK